MAISPSAMEKQPLLQTPPSDHQGQHSNTHSRTHEDEQDEAEEEETLSTLQQNVFLAQRKYMRAWSRTTSGKWHRRIILSVTILLFLSMLLGIVTIILSPTPPSPSPPSRDGNKDGEERKKVPLEAHIMSKCPDAKICLHDLVLPAMQQISDIVDFRLSYIGSFSPNTTEISCPHGPPECLGDLLELCAAHLYPSPKAHLGFTMCLTSSYADIPAQSLVSDCALEHALDIDAIHRCTVDDDGEMAVDMLRESFNRSMKAGVTKSCTVRLDEEIRCIVDGGEWKDCEGGHEVEDLVRDVKELYEKKNANDE